MKLLLLRTALGLAVLSGALASGAATASAQLQTSADRQALAFYEQGSTAYTEGRYEDAVRAFVQAYELSPRPLLLFNLANAYERMGAHREAIPMLEGYLPHAPADERPVLETRIANLRARVESSHASADGGGPLVPIGVGVGAAGLALVVTGVVFGALALDARQAAQRLCRTSPTDSLLCLGEVDGPLADAEVFALVADVGLFVGAGAAIAGTALVLLGLSSGSSGGSVGVAPDLQVGPAGASLGLRGRF